MKKSDLRNGMIVQYRSGAKRLVLNNILVSPSSYNRIEVFNEDLTNKENNFNDIIAIYSCENCKASLTNILTKEELILIWKRDETVIWEDVPFGTEVLCWDKNKEDAKIGRYLKYDSNFTPTYPHHVFVGTDSSNMFKYCEILEK